MMLGPALTSIPMFILCINWLLEGNFKTKWLQLKSNRIFWIVISLFFIHVIGLFYSQNIKDGFADLLIKLPIFLFSIVFFGSKPPSLKELHLILYCFLLGSLINTLWCFIYSFLLHQTETIRHVSRFMNHIRFGLYLNMAICCCVYFFSQQKKNWQKIVFILLGLYFTFTVYTLGLASGLFNLFLLALIFGIIIIFKQKLIFKLIILIILISSVFLLVNYVNEIYKTQITLSKITPSNSNILNENTQMENGNIVFKNVKNDELKQQWQNHFPSDSFNYEPSFNNINRYYVILRYLSSKGLTKDSVGISKLSSKDFNNIKNNITNYLHPNWGYLHKRMYELVNEYDEFKNKRNVNGHSLTMRIYFWKAAWQIIKNNLIIGVGTGDVQYELNSTYIQTNSPLNPEWRKRPHNQFITITVALGIVGLVFFLVSLFYPIIKLKKQLHVLYFPFFIILISSFMLEDTLESQAGLTFFVVFNSIFISRVNNQNI